jgi:hypothetical protein
LNPWTHVGGGGSGAVLLVQFTVVHPVQFVTQVLMQVALQSAARAAVTPPPKTDTTW